MTDRWIEDRWIEIEDKWIEIIQSKEQRQKSFSTSRNSGTYGIMQKVLTYM